MFHRISYSDKMLFAKHLAIMLRSGIPISDGVTTLYEQTTNKSFKKVLKKVLSDIENGHSVTDALGKHPEVFDPLYISFVKTGEESGKLPENLEYLADQLKKTNEFRKKVQSALLYPAFVIGTAIVVGGGISFFVLPQLIPLFDSLDVKLPLSTRILLWFATIMKNYWYIILAGAIGISVAFSAFIKTKPGKLFWHRSLIRIPVIGLIIQNAQMSVLCRNLGLMLSSGLPIVEALRTEREATSNLVYKEYINRLVEGVNKGKPIEEILTTTHAKYVPALATRMIGVGEKTGKLDESLLYLSDYFESEVDTMAKNLSGILEPVMLVGIGLAVAFVAMSIISPIYQLTGSIKK